MLRVVAGFDVCVFDAILSNNPAPPVDAGELTLGATGGDFGPPNPVKPAKISLDGDCDFCCGCGDVTDGNVNPLKASVRLFTFDCPEAVVPIDDVRSCCAGAGCGFGAVAYRDRIDCFKSGLETPAWAPDVGAVLPGRLTGVDWLLPKKSKPSNESAGFVCFAAAGCAELGGGGGRATAVGPVVLGRAGGLIASSSPKKSIDGCGCRRVGGWLETDARCDAERSSLALS